MHVCVVMCIHVARGRDANKADFLASRPRAQCFISRIMYKKGNTSTILKNFRLDINVFAGSL